jgi:hypothetical protein
MIRWFLGGEDGMAGGGGEARTISLCSVALSGMRVISDGRWLFVLHCEMLRTVMTFGGHRNVLLEVPLSSYLVLVSSYISYLHVFKEHNPLHPFDLPHSNRCQSTPA